MTLREALSEMSKGPVGLRYCDNSKILTVSTVKEDDILCLLESEREARRLR